MSVASSGPDKGRRRRLRNPAKLARPFARPRLTLCSGRPRSASARPPRLCRSPRDPAPSWFRGRENWIGVERLHRHLRAWSYCARASLLALSVAERSMAQVGALVRRHQLCRGNGLGLGPHRAADRRSLRSAAYRRRRDCCGRGGGDCRIRHVFAGFLRPVLPRDASLCAGERRLF